ncbi:hypothetical protein OHAE_127 [Ochrobactrum soli]|uniref:Uncharacterized protein n=1 Tax=Ochrobactrum soli TaxID=2448455 RepID=A0A2P9HKD8_9HYPH|nr:hypothetical protein OHAE_127 [[Ochrobactrum] soli]
MLKTVGLCPFPFKYWSSWNFAFLKSSYSLGLLLGGIPDAQYEIGLATL